MSDGPTNQDRAEWAAEAACVFALATGIEDESPATIAVDLIADLLHWVKFCTDLDGTVEDDTLPIDPESLLARALNHYQAELEDEDAR